MTNFNINVLALISCSKGLTQNGNVFLGRLLKGSKKRKKVLTCGPSPYVPIDVITQ